MTVATAPSVVSASAWRRIQTSLTAVLLVVGTAAGIAVAAQAPAVSPAPGLSRAVRAALREVGLPARRLHEEAFSF